MPVGTLLENVILWKITAQYDKGVKPSVALVNRSLVEVHTSDFFKSLYNNIGIVVENNAVINWSPSLKNSDGLGLVNGLPPLR